MQASNDVPLARHHVAGFDAPRRGFFVRRLWGGKGAFDAKRAR
jgi:hypothetical protein